MTQDEAAITVQTWNVWFGGREVDYGQEKQYAIAAQFPADVLALQECWGTAAENLAPKLGVNKAQIGWDTAVLSPHSLTQLLTIKTLPYAQAALVELLSGESPALIWSVHLAPYPYAAYRALAGEGQQVADEEEAPRLREIEVILEETERITAEYLQDHPQAGPLRVLICGDFNTPATADWAARPDRPDICWRSTDLLLDAGFIDTFRTVYPDPVVAPGESWSPIEPQAADASLDKPEPGRTDGPEPRDRIDFIFARGFEVVDAVMRGCTAEVLQDASFADVGGRCALIPDHRQNRFPSDHQLIEVKLRLLH